MRNQICVLLLVVLALITTNVWADDDESYSNYESIVNELKASADEPQQVLPRDDWDEVALHAGIGFTTSLVSLHLPDGTSASGLFKGLQVSAGVNLFSRDLRAEALYSAYQHEAIDSNLGGDLREFDMRLVYAPRTKSGMIARFGAGLAARYMDLNKRELRADTSYSSSTPSTLLLFGLERKLNKAVAIGPDISYRSALANGSFDKSSWDASFRLNATF